MNADEALELARKAYPNDEDLRVAYMLGLNEGYELHKDKIMNEAVEGEVIKTDKHTSVRYKSFYGTYRYFYGIADKQFKPGDKGHIIFVKEEGK